MPGSTTIHVMFVIRSLAAGGAERQLVELAKGLDQCRFRITLVTFYDGGALRPEVENAEGISVLSLRKKCRWDVAAFLRLGMVVRRARPDIMHGYSGVPNLVCLVIGRIARIRVVWGLRSSYLDLRHCGWLSRVVFIITAWLSPIADLLIYNSYTGRDYHTAHGYCARRTLVIPNGIDAERFHPDRAAGCRVRDEWGIGVHESVVGLVGRLDPVKDHPTFLHAAYLLVQERSDLRFVCIGDGKPAYRQEMETLADSLDLGHRLIFSGGRDDMPAVYNALDMLVSSSRGEGFSNAIGEAMACGVPCVVTDVGDSALIVGETGEVVPSRDPAALAYSIRTCIARLSGIGASGSARQRILEHFGVARLAQSTAEALEQLL
jgi:glycosyltransferase involved in cell wall biosynthesis